MVMWRETKYLQKNLLLVGDSVNSIPSSDETAVTEGAKIVLDHQWAKNEIFADGEESIGGRYDQEKNEWLELWE